MEHFLHDISWVVPLRSPELTVFFNGLTWLGYTTFFLIFLPIGYWLWDKNMFTRLAVLIIITGLINGFVKDLFHDPRPPLEFAIDPRTGDSYGFPSGHAQVAVAMWLWLAYEIGRTWAWIAAILIAVGVCMSRLYLGVHDVEDILGGTFLGLATIFAYRTLLSDEFNKLPVRERMARGPVPPRKAAASTVAALPRGGRDLSLATVGQGSATGGRP